MPFTLSHPLAVIPFRRLCPQWLNFAALVIGSTAPDFGYFASQFELAAFAHTIVGSFAVCLPTGLVALWIFYLLRQPLCYMLPEPHRSVLTPLATTRTLFTPRTFVAAAASLLLGAWTHSIWDSFTHRYGWPVKQIEFLHAPVFHIRGEEIMVYRVLQYASTAVGGLGLATLYVLWLRRQKQTVGPPSQDSDFWRYATLVAVLVGATALALIGATLRFLYTPGQNTLYRFAFWLTVYSVASFVSLFVITAIAAYARRNKSTARLEIIDGKS